MTKAIKAVRKAQRVFKAALHAGLYLHAFGLPVMAHSNLPLAARLKAVEMVTPSEPLANALRGADGYI